MTRRFLRIPPEPASSRAWLLAAALVLLATDTVRAEDLPPTTFGPAQAQLEIVLDELGLQDAVDNGQLAVALVELDGDDAVSLGMVNGHRMLYAASLPKIAILYGAAVALDRGRLTMTDALREDMVRMIRRSCNDCATRVLAKVGRQWLLDLLQSDPYRFYNPERGGGLWVGKDYARKGAFQREPMQGLSHAATPWQVARWFYLLNRGLLASPEQTDLMLECLSDPAIQHKFVKGLADQPDAELYRKSGTWSQYHADSMLVKDGPTSYILVALAADRRGGRWLEDIARHTHERLSRSDDD